MMIVDVEIVKIIPRNQPIARRTSKKASFRFVSNRHLFEVPLETKTVELSNLQTWTKRSNGRWRESIWVNICWAPEEEIFTFRWVVDGFLGCKYHLGRFLAHHLYYKLQPLGMCWDSLFFGWGEFLQTLWDGLIVLGGFGVFSLGFFLVAHFLSGCWLYVLRDSWW